MKGKENPTAVFVTKSLEFRIFILVKETTINNKVVILSIFSFFKQDT